MRGLTMKEEKPGDDDRKMLILKLMALGAFVVLVLLMVMN
jgi:hypothetical protein